MISFHDGNVVISFILNKAREIRDFKIAFIYDAFAVLRRQGVSVIRWINKFPINQHG